MAEQGVVLDIDTQFLQRLEKADKALGNLVTSVDKVSRKFDDMASGGLKNFANAIDSIVNAIGRTSSMKVGDMGLDKTTERAVEAADAINMVASNIQELSSTSVEPLSAPMLNTKETREEIKLLEKQLTQYRNALATANTKVEEWKSKKTTYERNDARPSDIKQANLKVEEYVNKTKILEKQISETIQKLKGLRASLETAISGFNVTPGMNIAELTELKKALDEVLKVEGVPLDKQQDYVDKFRAAEEGIREQMTSTTQELTEEQKKQRTEYQETIKELEALYASRRKIEDALNKAESSGLGASSEATDLRANLSDVNSEIAALYQRKQKAEKDNNKILEDIRLQHEQRMRDIETQESSKRLSIKQQEINKIRDAYKQILAEQRQLELQSYRSELFKAKNGSTPQTDAADAAIMQAQIALNEKRAVLERNFQALLTDIIEQENQKRGRYILENNEKQAQIDLARTAAENKHIDEIRAKYKSLLSEQQRLSSAMAQFDALSKNFGADKAQELVGGDLDKIKQEAQNVANEIVKIENDSWEHISDISHENAVAISEDRIKQAKQELKERQKLEEEASHNERTTFSGAMDFSKSTNSINEQIQAIKYLKEARDKLDKSELGDEEYNRQVKELNQEIDRQKESIDELTGKHKDLQDEQMKTSKISDKLRSALRSVFGIEAIRRYVNKLMQVRGEFELQQRSLQALLKNKAEANALWDKTVQLAMKSPYQIKELVTYTKQLAAYRVESSKLYETTKMLADISSGLGVDMSRLILAFGQVKAANYLRGTELRQFSEAGINILDELAKYYTNLEGRMVTVGQVFERVSKRMVTFQDVEKVLQNVTSAGGMFYNMQEIQAQTLRGQISNLKDSIDVMLNDIGKKNDGLLKGVVSTARTLATNWQTFADVLYVATAAFGAFKISALMANVTIKTFVKTMKTAMTTMKASIATINPWVVLFMGIAHVGAEIWGHFNELKRITKQYEELSRAIRSVAVEFKKAFDAKNMVGMRAQLSQLISMAQNEYNIKVNVEAETLNKLNSEAAKEMFDSLKQDLLETNALATEFARTIENAKFSNEMKWYLGGVVPGLFAGESIVRDLNQYDKTATKLFNRLLLEAKNVAYAVQDITDLTPEEKEALEMSSTPQGDRTQTEYIEDMSNAYDILAGRIEQVGFNTNKTERIMNRFNRRQEEAGREINKVFGNIDDAVKNLSIEDKEARIKFAIDEQDWTAFQKELAYKLANERWSINITPTVATDTTPVDEEWAKRVREAVTKVNEQIRRENKVPEGMQLFPVPDEGQTKEQYLALANDVIGIAEATYAEGQQIVGKDVVERAEILDGYSDQMRIILNLKKESTTQNESEARTLTNRINLIKQLNEEYNRLRESMGHDEAQAEVLRSFEDAFQLAFGGTDISLSDYDFTIVEGVIAALSKLRPLAEKEGHEAKIALEREIGEVDVTLKINERKSQDADFAQSIADMFSGYELSLELDKLNIPKGFAENYPGLEPVELSDIRERLETELELNKQMSKERKEQTEKDLKKVDELEDKAQQERRKKYLAYARDAIVERANIKLEEMRKLQEIELTFAEDDPMRQVASDKVREETKQSLHKLDWEEFQKSDTFINLFDDLDNASDALITHAISKLEEFKSQWTDMPHEEMKSIVEKINELRDKLNESENPFKRAKELRKERAKDPRTNDEIQLDNIQQEDKIAAAEEEISRLEIIRELIAEGKTEELEAIAIREKNPKLMNETVQSMNGQIKAQKEIISGAKDQIDKNNQILNTEEEIKASWQEQVEAIEQSQKMANDLYDACSDLMDVLGAGDGTAAIFADMGMSVANSVLSTVALSLQLKVAQKDAQGLGAAMNTAMGIIGWIVMAVQIISEVIGAIIKAHDNKLEKQIVRQQENVERLAKEYERLEEAIDAAFSTDQIEHYTDTIRRNIDSQITSLNMMIALEQDKKKTDDEKIKGWRDDIAELRKSYEDTLKDAFSTSTSGILDNVLDVTRDFVDAWADAFEETGFGMKGLQENFSEMMSEIIRQQAALTIVNPFINTYKNMLKEYIDPAKGDAVLSVEEAREWSNRVKETFPELNALLENFFLGAEDLLSKPGELSDLGAGIQGVTETTATALESLLNSIRYFSSDSNMRLRNIEISLAGGEIDTNSPMVMALKEQTELIRSIRDMFSGVIGAGGNGSPCIRTIII